MAVTTTVAPQAAGPSINLATAKTAATTTSAAGRPDETLPVLIAAEREAVDLLKAKQADLNEKIRERSGGREEYMKEREALRNQIGEITKQIAKIEDERREMSEREQRFGGSSSDVGMDASSTFRMSRNRLENFQRSAASGALYRTTAAIDERLKEIEYCIMTTSMTLKEEKVLKLEADKLRKNRVEVLEMEELEQRLSSSAAEQQAERKSRQSVLADRRTEIRDELRNLRDQRDALKVKLQVLETNRSNVLAPLKALYDHRDALRSQIAEHMAKINVGTEQLQMQEMEARAEQARKRQARAELDRFDRQLKVIEQDKKSLRIAIANTVTPEYDQNTMKALEMHEYLQHEISQYERAVARNTNAAASSEAAKAAAAQDETPERVELDNHTYVVHRKKVDDNVVVPSKRKTNKVTKTSVVSQYLNHSLASLNVLRSLNVSVPKTIDEARDTLKELDAIVSRQREKLEAAGAVQAKKQSELEKRLELLLMKEKELMSKAPQGWKPSNAAIASQNNQ